jgi:RNA polymerase sigma-70 factor (ECF subfamily)
MALPQLDDEVIRRAQRGDQQAFAQIVRTFQTPVFNYVLRVLGERGLAEDITQEVFLRVYQSLPRFSFRSKFSTWLFQVAKNRCVDELRARERRPRSTEMCDDGTFRMVDPPSDQAETMEALWRAVGELSLDYKMALLLRDVAGFSYSEIADILETTLANVKWRIYKARDEVQVALEREGVSFGTAERERPAKSSALA